MPTSPKTFDLEQLEERIRAAARMAPEKDTVFRKLVTRSKQEHDKRSSWQIPLREGTDECYAVELVPCGPDDDGAVALEKEHSDEQVRLDAQAAYDFWIENLPADALA